MLAKISHMLAWLYIVGVGSAIFVVFTCDTASKSYSYYQSHWIDVYTAKEDEVLKRKMDLRANDLASELANEFLQEPRNKNDWDFITKVQDPKRVSTSFPVDNCTKSSLVYSPLYEWAYEMAKGDESKETAFDYLEKGEMTFNKERNPPPPETVHHLKLELDNEVLKQIKS